MAFKNNKGFSLIEVIIAIAVLSLLLTPIMRQFSQSMNTSRKAKEQQYANEEAILELERAQTTKLKDYGTPTNASKVSQTVQLVDVNGNLLQLVDVNGNDLKATATDGSLIDGLQYNVYQYDLGLVELGSRNTEYQKTLTVDNISNKVRSCKSKASGEGLTISYDVQEGDLANLEGFVLTNEGSAVHYNADGYVDKIVCKETAYVGDPNQMNLGNMQNLDVDTVAMINGTTASFDIQANQALYALALDMLKEADYESWDQAVNGQESIYDQNGYTPQLNKLTKIYVDKLTDTEGKDYYLVKADIYYNTVISIKDLNGNWLPAKSKQLQYNVMSQRFYTDKCPDIFFEYQPYVNESTSGGNVTYASADYILMDCYVDDVKLYLYKPYKDQQSVAAGTFINDEISGGAYTYCKSMPPSDKDDYKTYTDNASNVVSIYLANASEKVSDVNIYTNLNVENAQFVCDPYDTIFIDNPDTDDVDESVKNDSKIYSTFNVREAFDRNYLKSLDDDVRYNERLYTVTVELVPTTETVNSVSLTGAKGEK